MHVWESTFPKCWVMHLRLDRTLVLKLTRCQLLSYCLPAWTSETFCTSRNLGFKALRFWNPNDGIIPGNLLFLTHNWINPLLIIALILGISLTVWTACMCLNRSFLVINRDDRAWLIACKRPGSVYHPHPNRTRTMNTMAPKGPIMLGRKGF